MNEHTTGGYTCWKCGKFVMHGETHICFLYDRPILIPYYEEIKTISCGDNPQCAKNDCVYYPNFYPHYGRQRCQNKSVLLDEEGKCISYVKKDGEE